jgi:uncharacterized protein (DUF362 family)
MTGCTARIGHILFTKEGSRESLMEIVSRLNLKPPIIIKPNWSTSITFTEAEILDWVLSAIETKAIVVESYAAWRCPLFLEYDGPRDSEFLSKLAKQKRNDFQFNDKWFLEYSGVAKVLKKHDTEYLNLSEELWSKRVCSPEAIRKEVDGKFETLDNPYHYSTVPERLFNMRGGTLLSIAKPKRSLKASHVSLSIKNLFGMIPKPWRGEFHGDNDALLGRSVADINKVYHSLFEVKGLIESVFSTCETIDDPLNPVTHRNMGLIWGSQQSVELDAFVCSQLGLNPNEVDYLRYAGSCLGGWKEEIIEYGSLNPVEFPREG